MHTEPESGFLPLFRSSPYLNRIGPFYSKGRGRELSVGLRVLAHHLNARGLVHGGVFMSMADIALGYAMATTADPPISAVTSSLTTDFAGTAELGDWIESRVEIQKIGSTLCFANVSIVRQRATHHPRLGCLYRSPQARVRVRNRGLVERVFAYCFPSFPRKA